MNEFHCKQEKAFLMWSVLFVVIIALVYCVLQLIYILLPICLQWIKQKDVPAEVYWLLGKYCLFSGKKKSK